MSHVDDGTLNALLDGVRGGDDRFVNGFDAFRREHGAEVRGCDLFKDLLLTLRVENRLAGLFLQSADVHRHGCACVQEADDLFVNGVDFCAEFGECHG